MPMVDFKLASERVGSTGGQTRGLQPTLINGNAAASVFGNMPQLNVHAADVQFTPVTPPRATVPDALAEGLKGGSELMNVWAQAAMQRQERVDTMTAQAAHAQIQMAYDKLLRGDGDNLGYLDSSVKDSTVETFNSIRGGYKNLMAEADKVTQMILSDATPNARMKAANAIMDSRRQLENNALNHRKQLEGQFGKLQYDVATIAYLPSMVEDARMTFAPEVLNSADPEVLQAALTQFKPTVDTAINQLGSVYGNGPMDATPASIVYSTLIQNLATSPNKHDQDIATLLYTAHADEIVDQRERKYTVDAIDKIQDRRASDMRFEVQTMDYTSRMNKENSTEFLNTSVVDAALSNDSEAVKAALDHARNLGDDTFSAAQDIIKAYNNLIPPRPEEQELLTEAVLNGYSPAQVVERSKEMNLGIPTYQVMNTAREAYVRDIGGLIDSEVKRASAALQGQIDLYKQANADSFAVLMMGSDGLVATEALKQNARDVATAAGLQYMKERKGQELNKTEMANYIRDKVDLVINADVVNSKYGAVLNKQPDILPVYELRNQPAVQSAKFNQATDPFTAIAALQFYIDKGYITDPVNKEAAAQLLKYSKDPAKIAKFKQWAKGGDSESYGKAVGLVNMFLEVYMDMQQSLWNNTPNLDQAAKDTYGRRINGPMLQVFSSQFGLLKSANDTKVDAEQYKRDINNGATDGK